MGGDVGETMCSVGFFTRVTKNADSVRCRRNAHNEMWQNVIHGSRRRRQKKGNSTSVPFGKAGGIATPVL